MNDRILDATPFRNLRSLKHAKRQSWHHNPFPDKIPTFGIVRFQKSKVSHESRQIYFNLLQTVMHKRSNIRTRFQEPKTLLGRTILIIRGLVHVK